MEEKEKVITCSLAKTPGRIVAAAVTVFMLIFIYLHKDLFLLADLPKGQTLWTLSMIAAPVAGALILFNIEFSEKIRPVINTVIFFVLPVVSVQMVECFGSKYIWEWEVEVFMLNYITYLVLFLIVYFISGRFHITNVIVNSFLYVWSLVNYFVTLFRTSPFIPMDILTIKTGLNVADGYTYELSWQLILGSILFLLIFLVNRRVKSIRPKKKLGKTMVKVLPAAYLAVILITFFFTDYTANIGYKPDFWNQARGYKKTGTFFNFCLNTKYLVVKKPSGYNASNVEGYLNDYLASNDVDPEGETCVNLLTGENDYPVEGDGVNPNIIYIMNESLSDLTQLGDLETNEDTMPFIHGLTENTIKGLVTVPVFGAGTSNSEFESLTGDSISFLPAGCNVYQTFLKNETPSLVSTLDTLGYSRTAFHPYYGDGWNRQLVYPLLHFDDFISLESFVAQDIIDTYKANNDVNEYEDLLKERYPEKKMLLRRFISDSYDYKMIEEMYEERDSSQPFFVFNVTMQNHGGYAVSYRNFYQSIFATNTSTSYKKANRYLSLVKRSDDAFRELITYFEKVEEPTVICMFGDHLASIEDEFYAELFGVKSLDDLSTKQQHMRYNTPFVIWANYDIPEGELQNISVNYLSTLLAQTAGLPMTQYNKYLASLYQDMPVISTVGYVDKDENYYLAGETTGYEDLLKQYYCIEYNSLFDKKNRKDSLFYLQ